MKLRFKSPIMMAIVLLVGTTGTPAVVNADGLCCIPEKGYNSDLDPHSARVRYDANGYRDRESCLTGPLHNGLLVTPGSWWCDGSESGNCPTNDDPNGRLLCKEAGNECGYELNTCAKEESSSDSSNQAAPSAGTSSPPDSSESQAPTDNGATQSSEGQAPAEDSAQQPPTSDDSAQQTDEQKQEDERAAEREQEFEAQQAQKSNSQASATPNESGDNGNESPAGSSISTSSAEDQEPQAFAEEQASAIESAQADQPQPAEPSEPMDNVVQLASNSVSTDGTATQPIPDGPVWQEASADVSADSSPSESTGTAYDSVQSFGNDFVGNLQGELPANALDYLAEGILPAPVETLNSALADTIQSRVEGSISRSEDQTDPVGAISGQIDQTFSVDLMVQLVRNGFGFSPLNDAKAVWSYLSNIVKLDIVRNGAAQVQAPIDGSTDDQH